MLICAMLFPMLAGILISVPRMEVRMRNRLYAGAILITDILCLLAAMSGGPVTVLTLTEKLQAHFMLDGIGRIVLLAVCVLYTAVLFYAFEYMTMEERPHVFFAFFFISFGALIAVCMAGNLVTLYFAFELLTLTSMPLVLHEMTKDAVAAALKYLFYSIAGALMGLLAVFFIYQYTAGDGSFVFGGFLSDALLQGHEKVLLAVTMAGIIGFGTKAGLYPMHGWLPTAHPIAPAPASALLSGIVAKAGVIAIIRVVYFAVGPDRIRGTWVQTAWMTLCLLTIFMGSMMAFREKIMKKRLAYSTISQISYILLGLSFLSDEGLRGGLLHLMSHAVSKGCLFLVAGVFIYKLGVRNVADLKGVGKRMPVTLWCFTIAALSLVGIPPMGGFLSKWVIASSAIGSGIPVYAVLAPVVLLISALLTAGYLLPITVDGFFPGHAESAHGHGGAKEAEEEALPSAEPTVCMTIPMMCLCAAALVMGLFGTQILSAFGI